MSHHVYLSGIGESQQLSVVLPAQKPPRGSDGYPILFAVHGGGWYRFDRRDIIAKVRPLLEAGFAVVAPDFTQARFRTPSWPRNLSDLQASLDWTLANASKLGLDSTRIALVGESSGGHLAALLSIVNAGKSDKKGGPVIDELITIAAPLDLTDIHTFAPGTLSKIQDMLGSPFRFDLTTWHSASPQSLLEASPTMRLPRVLMIHGSFDSVVPVSQADAFANLLNARNADYRFLRLAGADHSLLGATHEYEVTSAIREFLTGRSR